MGLNKNNYLSVLMLLATVPSISNAGITSEKITVIDGYPTMEVIDFVLEFSKDKSEKYSLPWTTQANNPAIEWITEGVQRGERKGEVILTDKREYPLVLRKRLEPMTYQITLKGSRAGLGQVKIESGITSQELSGRELISQFEDAKYRYDAKIEKVSCYALKASYGGALYKYETSSKYGWVLNRYSCGSAGCSGSYTIYLSEPNLQDKIFKDFSPLNCN
jgi:hypothetical protein